MRKKGTTAGIIIFILLLLLITIIIYVKPKQLIKYIVPQIQLSNIDVTIGNDTAYVRSKIAIRNRLFLKFNVDSIKYKLSLFDKVYFSDHVAIDLLLKAYGKDTIKFPVKIPYKQLYRDLKNPGDSTDYQLDLTMLYNTFLGRIEIPFNKEGRFKLPRFPDIKVENIKYRKNTKNTLAADILLKIFNYNNFSMLIKGIDYQLEIEESAKVSGNFSETLSIQPQQETQVTIPVEVKLKNIGKTIFQIIKDEDTYSYSLSMNAVLEFPEIKQTTPLSLSAKGKLELIK